jgi:hypothetical protein
MANTYVKIGSTVTVGLLGAANIEFTSIPATFTDLKLVFSARTTNAGNEANVSISLNGSTSGFSQRGLYGDGASAGSFSRTDNLNIALVTSSGNTASTFGNAEIYFPNYAGSTNKSFSVDDVTEGNMTTAYAQMHAGLWSNTAAITSITLTPQGLGNFVQYSTASLYGISKS